MIDGLIAALPPVQRLALAYATADSRAPLTLVFALDARLAGLVRSAREPMLAQLRLAWWRERLLDGGAGGEAHDPLLGLLGHWPAERATLAGLADGWEGMTGSAPLPADAFIALADARAEALAALSQHAAARRMGHNWALADIATHLSDPREREGAWALARAQDWRQERLDRGLRPLAVLHTLAARAIAMDNASIGNGAGDMLRAMRVGLFGR